MEGKAARRELVYLKHGVERVCQLGCLIEGPMGPMIVSSLSQFAGPNKSRFSCKNQEAEVACSKIANRSAENIISVSNKDLKASCCMILKVWEHVARGWSR